MSEHFRGRVPGDLAYDTRYDMWLRRDADGTLTVGATAFGLWLAGEVIAFTAKPRGAEIACGRGLATVETGKTILAVHSPAALRLREANEALEDDATMLNRDPYGDGWMARGDALAWADDQRRLVDAAAYRAHCLSVDPDAEFID
jgi:glycine cleavage system H protein